MAANLGKLFRFGAKKPSKKPTTDTASGNLSDDDDGYVDPTESCSTLPPGLTRQMIPNYPPPRPGSSSSPLTGKKLPIKKDEYQDPWDSKEMSNIEKLPKLNDTYEDPFDAMKSSKSENLNDLQTLKTTKTSKSTDDENDSKTLPFDTYKDPWDSFSGKNKMDFENAQNNAPAKKKDDYSDPWDSKKCNSKSYDEYDDTYSEPYDKNKLTVMDSTPRGSGSDVEEDGDLYEMPYEERVMLGVEPKLNGNLKSPGPLLQPLSPQFQPLPPQPIQPAPYSSAKSKQSSSSVLPSASEYDAPWEWKMKNVEADFEKRFSVGVDPASANKSSLNSSQSHKKPVPAVRNQSITSMNSSVVANPVQKPARSNIDVTVSKADDILSKYNSEYEVDPTIPLKNQGWFHGTIRRDHAEDLLKSMPDCSYLIRDSESSKLNYSLSLKNKGETMHLKISCQNGKYILGMNSKPYDTIPEMIHYYSMNKLNIRGAEHVKLSYPVLQEAVYFTVEPGT